MKLDELKTINSEIATYVERYYADLPASTPVLNVLSPHTMAHQIAANYPGLGAAFYRLVAEAARECWNTMLGIVEQPAPEHPRVSPALASLINSKDSSWF